MFQVPVSRVGADLAHVHAPVGRVRRRRRPRRSILVLRMTNSKKSKRTIARRDELAERLRSDEAEHAVLAAAGVDLDRRVGPEELGELGPRPARHDVGVRVLEAPDRDVVVGLAHRRSRCHAVIVSMSPASGGVRSVAVTADATPAAPGIDAGELVEAACERAGLDDLGDDAYRDGLDLLVDGLHAEARLSELGIAITPDNLIELPHEPAPGRRTGTDENPDVASTDIGADRLDDRHGPHRHDDPARPPRPGPGEPRAADAGRSTARSLRPRRRRTTPTRASPRCRRASTSVTRRDPRCRRCTRPARGSRRSACASRVATSRA